MGKKVKKQKYPQEGTDLKRSCLLKIGYSSEKSAIESKAGSKFKTRAYKCENCGKWHTTKQTKRPKNAI